MTNLKNIVYGFLLGSALTVSPAKGQWNGHIAGMYNTESSARAQAQAEYKLNDSLTLGANGLASQDLLAIDGYGTLSLDNVDLTLRGGVAAGDITFPYAGAEADFTVSDKKPLTVKLVGRGVLTSETEEQKDDTIYSPKSNIEGLVRLDFKKVQLDVGYGQNSSALDKNSGLRAYATVPLNEDWAINGGYDAGAKEGTIALIYNFGKKGTATITPVLFPGIDSRRIIAPQEPIVLPEPQPAPYHPPEKNPPSKPDINGGEDGGDLIDPNPTPITGGEDGGDLIIPEPQPAPMMRGDEMGGDLLR